MINYFSIMNIIICSFMSKAIIFDDIFETNTWKDKIDGLKRLGLLTSSYTILSVIEQFTDSWLVNLLLIPLAGMDLILLSYLFLFHFDD